MRILLIIIAAIFGLLFLLLRLAWVGLHVRPKAISPYPDQTPALERVDLPRRLPSSVPRFYKTIIGDRVPLIEPAMPGQGQRMVPPRPLPTGAALRGPIYEAVACTALQAWR